MPACAGADRIVLNSMRQKLSVMRRRPSPVASLLDFALWVLRNALQPWRPKFWLVVGVVAAGTIGAALLPAGWGVAVAVATALFAVATLLMLLLSYFRTMLSTQYSVLENNGERLASRVAQTAGRVQAERRSDQAAMRKVLAGLRSPAAEPDLRLRLLGDLLDTEFFETLAREHDALRAEVAALRARLDADGSHADASTARLEAELAELKRQTERQLRLDTGAIAQMAARIDRLTQSVAAQRAAASGAAQRSSA